MSSVAMVAISLSVNSKLEMSVFCCIRSMWIDLGMMMTPRWINQRRAICTMLSHICYRFRQVLNSWRNRYGPRWAVSTTWCACRTLLRFSLLVEYVCFHLIHSWNNLHVVSDIDEMIRVKIWDAYGAKLSLLIYFSSARYALYQSQNGWCRSIRSMWSVCKRSKLLSIEAFTFCNRSWKSIFLIRGKSLCSRYHFYVWYYLHLPHCGMLVLYRSCDNRSIKHCLYNVRIRSEKLDRRHNLSGAFRHRYSILLYSYSCYDWLFSSIKLHFFFQEVVI